MISNIVNNYKDMVQYSSIDLFTRVGLCDLENASNDPYLFFG